jgi:hypothetical protein
MAGTITTSLDDLIAYILHSAGDGPCDAQLFGWIFGLWFAPAAGAATQLIGRHIVFDSLLSVSEQQEATLRCIALFLLSQNGMQSDEESVARVTAAMRSCASRYGSTPPAPLKVREQGTRYANSAG